MLDGVVGQRSGAVEQVSGSGTPPPCQAWRPAGPALPARSPAPLATRWTSPCWRSPATGGRRPADQVGAVPAGADTVYVSVGSNDAVHSDAAGTFRRDYEGGAGGP